MNNQKILLDKLIRFFQRNPFIILIAFMLGILFFVAQCLRKKNLDEKYLLLSTSTPIITQENYITNTPTSSNSATYEGLFPVKQSPSNIYPTTTQDIEVFPDATNTRTIIQADQSLVKDLKQLHTTRYDIIRLQANDYIVVIKKRPIEQVKQEVIRVFAQNGITDISKITITWK